VRTRRLGLEVEAFGIVYLEAAACGLRVVGGRSGGAEEAVALARAARSRTPAATPATTPSTTTAPLRGRSGAVDG
jgi:phosphatidylinositol alpha-1,6-mannosyltransferase